MTSETKLYRQVHPTWVQEGRATSQTFKPTKKDEGKPSLYDGDQISAEEAFLHYTGNLQLASRGVLAVTGGECETCQVTVTLDGVPYQEHGYLDMTHMTSGQIDKLARKLLGHAQERGWQHFVEDDNAKSEVISTTLSQSHLAAVPDYAPDRVPAQE